MIPITRNGHQIELFQTHEGKAASLIPGEIWEHILSNFSEMQQLRFARINTYFNRMVIDSPLNQIYWKGCLDRFTNSVFDGRSAGAKYLNSARVQVNILKRNYTQKTLPLDKWSGNGEFLNIHCGEKRVYLGTSCGNIIWWDPKNEECGQWRCPYTDRGIVQVYSCKEKNGLPYVGCTTLQQGVTRSIVTRASSENGKPIFVINTENPIPSFEFHKDTLYLQYDKRTIKAYHRETGEFQSIFIDIAENSNTKMITFKIDEKKGLLYLFLADEDSISCRMNTIKVFDLMTQNEPIEIKCDIAWLACSDIQIVGKHFYVSYEDYLCGYEIAENKLPSFIVRDTKQFVVVGDHLFVSEESYCAKVLSSYTGANLTGCLYPNNFIDPLRLIRLNLLGAGKGYYVAYCFDELRNDIYQQNRNPRLELIDFDIGFKEGHSEPSSSFISLPERLVQSTYQKVARYVGDLAAIAANM